MGSVSRRPPTHHARSLAFEALPGQTEFGDESEDASLSGPATCQSPSQLGLAKFDDAQHFVHGLRVCTNGTIPRVQGIEIYAAKVHEDGTVGGGRPANGLWQVVVVPGARRASVRRGPSP